MTESFAADPRRTFDGVADAYAASRPHYPAALFDELFALLPPQPRLVEVGPGTGQATVDLIARGARVLAVELGPALAERLRAGVPSSDLDIVVGDFEDVELPAESFDGLVSASAYHWISPSAQVDRPAGLLRAGGVAGIITLVQVTSPDDHGFYDAVQSVYNRYGESHRGPPAPVREAVLPEITTAFMNDRRFVDVVQRQWDWNQTYTSQQFELLMRSYSVTQLMDPIVREQFLGEMKAFVDSEFGGMVTRPLVVTLTTAIKRGGSGATDSVRRVPPAT